MGIFNSLSWTSLSLLLGPGLSLKCYKYEASSTDMYVGSPGVHGEL